MTLRNITLGSTISIEKCTIKHIWPMKDIEERNKNVYNSESQNISFVSSIASSYLERDVDNNNIINDGPLSDVSEKVVIMELVDDFNDTIIAYFYDKWAEMTQNLRKHFVLEFYGAGILVETNDRYTDTNGPNICLVFAEKNLQIKKCSETIKKNYFIKFIFYEALTGRSTDQITIDNNITQEITSENIHSLQIFNSIFISATGKRCLNQIKDRYIYTPLAELKIGICSIYGVLINFNFPKSDNKRSWMSMVLVDPSIRSKQEGLEVTLFYPLKDAIYPKLLSIGDVIRFHKLKIGIRTNHAQGTSSHGVTRCVIIRKAPEEDYSNTMKLEILKQTKTITFDESDYKKCRELILWSKKFLAQDSTLPRGCPMRHVEIASITNESGQIDLIAKIIKLDKKSDTDITLSVWDGTADPELGLMSIQIIERYSILKNIGFLEKCIGQWCKFRSLAIKSINVLSDTSHSFHPNVISGIINEYTTVMLIPAFSFEVRQILRNVVYPLEDNQHEVQIIKNDSLIIQDRLVLGVIKKIPGVDLTCIADVHKSTKIPSIFSCRVRVTSFWPNNPENCILQTHSKILYMFVLRLEDYTASVDAIVYDEDGFHLFGDTPPEYVISKGNKYGNFNNQMNKIIKETHLQPCYIKKYYVAQSTTKGKVNKVIRYRMFNTKIINI